MNPHSQFIPDALYVSRKSKAHTYPQPLTSQALAKHNLHRPAVTDDRADSHPVKMNCSTVTSYSIETSAHNGGPMMDSANGGLDNPSSTQSEPNKVTTTLGHIISTLDTRWLLRNRNSNMVNSSDDCGYVRLYHPRDNAHRESANRTSWNQPTARASGRRDSAQL